MCQLEYMNQTIQNFKIGEELSFLLKSQEKNYE